jgi:predicted  nucleic acid-binding Zn-ribbon protein
VLPELTALLDLQRQDSLLLDAKRKREAIPARQAALRDALVAAQAEVERAKKDLDQARKDRRGFEKEVETVAAEAGKLERQLADVKTNKEYQALLHEIELFKGKRSDHETRILECFEREETLAAALTAAEKRVKAEEARLQEGEAALAREGASLDQSIHSITQDRDAVKPRVPAALLSRYERVLAARDGVAVVEVKKGSCGACFKGLTPHALQEARRGDTIQSCESCGRILVLIEAGTA